MEEVAFEQRPEGDEEEEAVGISETWRLPVHVCVATGRPVAGSGKGSRVAEDGSEKQQERAGPRRVSSAL